MRNKTVFFCFINKINIMDYFFKTMFYKVKHYNLFYLIGAFFIMCSVSLYMFNHNNDPKNKICFYIIFICLALAGIIKIYFSISNTKILENRFSFFLSGMLTILIALLVLKNFEKLEIIYALIILKIGFSAVINLKICTELKNYGMVNWSK